MLLYILVNFAVSTPDDLKFTLMYYRKLHYNVTYIKTTLWWTIYKMHLDVHSPKKKQLNEHQLVCVLV